MNRAVRWCSALLLLVATAQRLPAPIQEIETPTPAAQQSSTPSVPPPSPPPSFPADQVRSPRLLHVTVKKYSVTVLLPADVFPDFQRLTTGETSFLEHNGVSLAFYDSQRSLRQTFDDHVMGRLVEVNQNIDYKVLKDTWFVVSGTFGVSDERTGFYTKGIKKGGNVIMMRLHYDEENSPFSDETLTAISRSFSDK